LAAKAYFAATGVLSPEMGSRDMENLSMDVSAEIKWSHWSRCESSFSMLLVPHRPGVLALAEEVAGPNGNGKRMLALFHVVEAYDLSAAVSELFSTRSPYREQLEQRRCFARYAMISDPENRTAVAATLHAWMAAHVEAATGIAQQPVSARSESESNCDCDPADCTHSPQRVVPARTRRELGRPAFPAGF
jgi:hypothetical protein